MASVFNFDLGHYNPGYHKEVYMLKPRYSITAAGFWKLTYID